MSDDDLWIVIPNWWKHQHYSDRSPPWIKLHTELAHKDEWNDLTLAARGLLTTIWIEFCASDGRVKARSLPAVCRQRVRRETLNSLVEAGFVALSASKPSRARSREGLSSKDPKGAGARDGASARARAQEKEPEPLRDPEALAKMLELQAHLGRRW